MVTINNRCVEGFKEALTAIPQRIIGGSLFGAVYAAFSGLPLRETMAAIAMSEVTVGIFKGFINGAFQDIPIINGYGQISVIGANTYFWVNKLENSGLMGPQLKIYYIACNAFVCGMIASSMNESLKSNRRIA